MKCIAISDLHGYLPKIEEECDVVIIAGDITPLDVQHSLARSLSWFLLDFKPWADNLPCEKVIFIPGNHDKWLEELGPKQCHTPSEVMKIVLGNHKKDSKLVYLTDNSYEYKGKRFYGFPWCPNLVNWSFYKSDEDLEQACRLIPRRIDVLITHCPPTSLQGIVHQRGWNYMKDFGCTQLANELNFIDVKWCVCGHIHSGKHQPDERWGTKIVNVSLKDEDYKVSYEPFVFEI